MDNVFAGTVVPGAVRRVSRRAGVSVRRRQHGQPSRPPAARRRPAPGPDDLLQIGVLATRLNGSDFGQALRECADFLRTATNADDCEILLREPDGGDLILTECVGADSGALQERLRFEKGVGFPGIVLATGRPLATRHLSNDRRFVRRQLTESGVQGFLAVPLGDAADPLGCIDLAWRSADPPIKTALTLVEHVAGQIVTAFRAGLLSARELLERRVQAVPPDGAARALACLQAIVEVAGSRSGALALFDRSGGETTIYSTSDTIRLCPNAVDGRAQCAPLAEGHAVVLNGPRTEWRDACQCLPDATHSAICLPIRANHRLQGVFVLDRGGTPPVPSTRDLVPLRAMAMEASAWLSSHRPRPASAGDEDMMGDPVLELRCFGGFDVRLNGQPVPAEAFARRKALAVLRMLVMSGGNPMNRDVLIERIWPEVDPAVGANRLHGVLHALRSAIEPFHAQRRWIFVRNVGQLYYFNMASPHWTDVHAFRQLVTSAHQAERSGQRREAIQHLERALSLYRGDLFADDPYAAWCESERAQLRRRFVDLTAHLAGLWLVEHDVERGLAWLRQGLLTDPLREDLHQRLIRSLLDLGRHEEALAQYRACASRLREELDTSPLPETEELARRAACAPSRRMSGNRVREPLIS